MGSKRQCKGHRATLRPFNVAIPMNEESCLPPGGQIRFFPSGTPHEGVTCDLPSGLNMCGTLDIPLELSCSADQVSIDKAEVRGCSDDASSAQGDQERPEGFEAVDMPDHWPGVESPTQFPTFFDLVDSWCR